ncbi:hypothetical protein niasHT_007501 [Heterodera trifolii]|uniref:Uncharacterized protein n=1 Tax=Heterodera trifolii TaxID=157864 RepID=A0ABD2LPB7_9BILA
MQSHENSLVTFDLPSPDKRIELFRLDAEPIMKFVTPGFGLFISRFTDDMLVSYFKNKEIDKYQKNVPSHLRYFYLIRAVWKIELVDEQRAEWEKRAEDEPHLVELSDNSPDLFDRILKREIDRKLYERSEAFEEFKLRENAFKEYFMNKYDKNLEIPSDSPFEKLLKAGGLVSIKNKAGWNSLDEAVANGDRNIAGKLHHRVKRNRYCNTSECHLSFGNERTLIATNGQQLQCVNKEVIGTRPPRFYNGNKMESDFMAPACSFASRRDSIFVSKSGDKLRMDFSIKEFSLATLKCRPEYPMKMGDHSCAREFKEDKGKGKKHSAKTPAVPGLSNHGNALGPSTATLAFAILTAMVFTIFLLTR